MNNYTIETELGDRSKYFGATDFAVILGKSKYKKSDQLFLEKYTDMVFPENSYGKAYMDFGSEKEDSVLNEIEFALKVNIYGRQATFVYDKIEGDKPIKVHADGLTVIDHEDHYVECKTMGKMFSEIDDFRDLIKHHYAYYIQCQMGMFVAGIKKCLFVIGERVGMYGNFELGDVKYFIFDYDEAIVKKGLQGLFEIIKHGLELQADPKLLSLYLPDSNRNAGLVQYEAEQLFEVFVKMKDLKRQESEAKELILSKMIENDIKTIKTEVGTFTVKGPYKKLGSIDTKVMKVDGIDIEGYRKASTEVKASLSITFKKV